MVKSHPSQGVASLDKEKRQNKSTECRYCDRDFDSYMGRRKHEGLVHNEPYQDESVLKELYIEKGMSMADIADKFGVKPSLIDYWLKENDIQTRGVHESQTSEIPNFKTQTDGYEWATTRVNKETKYVEIHRLLAISEFGFDAVSDRVVHHKNEVPWDNRPENIELMTRSEHAKHHHGESNQAND